MIVGGLQVEWRPVGRPAPTADRQHCPGGGLKESGKKLPETSVNYSSLFFPSPELYCDPGGNKTISSGCPVLRCLSCLHGKEGLSPPCPFQTPNQKNTKSRSRSLQGHPGCSWEVGRKHLLSSSGRVASPSVLPGSLQFDFQPTLCSCTEPRGILCGSFDSWLHPNGTPMPVLWAAL